MITRSVGAPIRLGVTLDLYPNEWLHSAISRWAWQTFGVSRAALLDAFGLANVPHTAIIAMGTRLLPEIAQNISSSTGIDEARLRKATMVALDETLLRLTARVDGQPSSVVSKEGPWSWNVGTRYCPDCLRDRPGVFEIRWRSPWAFACTEHRCLLLDSCPECQGEIVEMRGRNTDVFDPSTCRADVGPKGAPRRTACRALLTESWEQFRLDPESPPLLAQRLIYLQAENGSAREFIQLLQSAGTAIRGAKDFELMAALSDLDAGELRGLFDDEKHIGTAAPKSAYAMAGLAGAALVLCRLDERVAGPIIRRTTFARPPGFVPRGAGHGPGSPAELLTRWPDAPTPLRAKILRAHDQDLTITQRVLGCTTVDPRTLESHQLLRGNLAERNTYVPDLLWPAWCSRLDVGGAVSGPTLAGALAHALRLCGTTRQEYRPDTDESLARILRPNMLGRPDQTRALLAGISELAHTVDDDPGPINYFARLGLPSNELLPWEHWSVLSESIGRDPGAERRHRNARRYLWQRLTATDTPLLPEDLRMGRTPADAAEYTDFRTRMTQELQSELDAYGRAFLRHNRIHEPVTWSPPVSVHVDWPGTEILDLQVERLHDMLRDNVVSHQRLANELGVTTRKIARAIDEAPPALGPVRAPIEWAGLIPVGIPDRTEREWRTDDGSWFMPRRRTSRDDRRARGIRNSARPRQP